MKKKDFTFIDLFAGIGGTRLGFEAAGGECVFTSEWDKYANKTYLENFGNGHPLAGDITKIDASDIPDHDVLIGGFPCQPFSIAGVSKKNSMGRKHGFSCETQGTLFFDICRILDEKRPAAFMLENVKNLRSHDKGRTFETIKKTLTEELGYEFHYRTIDARHFVPQHRERVFMVGFREPTTFNFDSLFLPDISVQCPVMGDILHSENGIELPEGEYTSGKNATVNSKYILSQKLWNYLKEYAEKHKAKGNGFGFGLVDDSCVSRTLSARYYKDGSEILVNRGRKNPRRLTPRECARLMGFPDSFKIPVSDTQAYKQFGNSVVVPVISAVSNHMRDYIISIKSADINKAAKCG